MAEAPQRPSNNDYALIPMSQRDTSDSLGVNASNLRTFTEGTVLSFHNISYREKVKSGFLLRKTSEVERLSNVSGIMKRGLNAIMGPQDGGRSVLLDVLAGRKDPRGLTGSILINGAPQPANFRCYSGYVAQNNMAMYTITVRENIQFSAALRLPATVTNDQRNGRINEVIKLLGLEEVANCKVTSQKHKKLIDIAMELVTDHPILFLDKPTMGLNASMANDVIVCLRKMAKQGRTIIFSINRPWYSIFRLFDSLTLIASGKVMFHGPAQKALEFFQSAGYHCETHNSPADFLMDLIDGVIIGDSSAVLGDRQEEYEVLFQKENHITEKVATHYTISSYYQQAKAELDQLSGGQEVKGTVFPEITYATSFWHQLRWMTWRSFRNLTGFLLCTMIEAVIMVLLATIIGGGFLGLRNDCNEVWNRAIFLYVLTSFQCVISVLAEEFFIIDKHFLHEDMGGYYRVTPYFLGNLISELIPRLLSTVIFTSIAYGIAGAKTNGTVFVIMMLTLLLLAYSVKFLQLSTGRNKDRVTQYVLLYFMFMLIFSGLLLYSGTLMPQLSWLLYLSIPYYGFTALQHNEFLGQNFCPEFKAEAISRCQNYVICTGEEFLEMQGIDLSSWGLWKNHVALACIMIVLFLITYLKLVLVNKKYP